jgi:hypothetical protein
VHEQHVGVRAVGHLPAAEPAHADDGEVRRQLAGRGAGLGGVRPHRDVQADLQRGDGDVGERPADLRDVQHAQQVRGGDPQQLVPAQSAQHPDAGVGSAARPAACRHAAARASAVRGRSSSSSARIRSASGVRVSSAATYWLEPSSAASRSATCPSSRSSRRYHWLPPRASLTLR